MSQPRADARWPKVLSLAVHELRTPMTVVAGYIRMLLKDRAGPLTDPQRRLLEEAEKSCGRLSALLAEMSDLSGLEAGTATFNRVPIDLRAALSEAVVALPELQDRPIAIDLQVAPGPAVLEADPVRLRAAFAAVLSALRRELVSSTTLWVRESVRQIAGRTTSWIAIADPSRIRSMETANESTLATFDEWRGGCGLSLGVARRVLEAHGGHIWSPVADAKAGAVIVLPHL
jgi:two-component system, OmpR family, sensor histidine kinase VicK